MDRTVYANTVRRYIEQLEIDCFAVPTNIGGEIFACLFNPDTMVHLVQSDSALIEYGKNETFPRWGRILTPTKVISAIHPFVKIPMGISAEDFKAVKAMEWEQIILARIGGEYTGKDLHNVDIIHPIYGKIEIKKGRGKIGEYA